MNGSYEYNRDTRVLTVYNEFNQVVATLSDVDEGSCEMLFDEVINEEPIGGK